MNAPPVVTYVHVRLLYSKYWLLTYYLLTYLIFIGDETETTIKRAATYFTLVQAGE